MNSDEQYMETPGAASEENLQANESLDTPEANAINELEEDIIRNDTIPETKRNMPGSNGALPVGAFDTSKD